MSGLEGRSRQISYNRTDEQMGLLAAAGKGRERVEDGGRQSTSKARGAGDSASRDERGASS